MKNDEQYMKRALELARNGRGRTSPNPMVGAVIVKDERTIGEGWHEQAGGPHAEINALAAAGDAARGATMYVTLEPCTVHGRTPQCAPALAKAGLKRVVVAMTDPNPQVSGRGITALKKGGVEVTEGVLKHEARRLNEIYNKYITTGVPFVMVKVAMSLDAKIAAPGGSARWITGEGSRRMVHELRAEYDAVMTGIGTVLADNPSLTARVEDVAVRQPLRIILDSQGKTPLDALMVTTASDAPTMLVTTNVISLEKMDRLAKAGVEVVIMRAENGRIPLRDLLVELGEREITSIMVEAGAVLTSALIDEFLYDKVTFFVAPKLLGSGALSFYNGAARQDVNKALAMDVRHIERTDDDIVIEAYRRD